MTKSIRPMKLQEKWKLQLINRYSVSAVPHSVGPNRFLLKPEPEEWWCTLWRRKPTPSLDVCKFWRHHTNVDKHVSSFILLFALEVFELFLSKFLCKWKWLIFSLLLFKELENHFHLHFSFDLRSPNSRDRCTVEDWCTRLNVNVFRGFRVIFMTLARRFDWQGNLLCRLQTGGRR